eukprot:scaffold18456_cov124-Isochrysis_galbana.AAC.4
MERIACAKVASAVSSAAVAKSPFRATYGPVRVRKRNPWLSCSSAADRIAFHCAAGLSMAITLATRVLSTDSPSTA